MSTIGVSSATGSDDKSLIMKPLSYFYENKIQLPDDPDFYKRIVTEYYPQHAKKLLTESPLSVYRRAFMEMARRSPNDVVNSIKTLEGDFTFLPDDEVPWKYYKTAILAGRTKFTLHSGRIVTLKTAKRYMDYYTVIWKLIEDDRYDILKELLKLNLDIDKRGQHDLTALHYAARYGSVNAGRAILDVLKEHWCKIMKKRKISIDGLYIDDSGAEKSVDRNPKKYIDSVMYAGPGDYVASSRNSTALHIAVHYGHTEFVKFLLEKGANIEARDIDGLTPLAIAVKHNKLDIYNLLLERGANPANVSLPIPSHFNPNRESSQNSSSSSSSSYLSTAFEWVESAASLIFSTVGTKRKLEEEPTSRKMTTDQSSSSNRLGR